MIFVTVGSLLPFDRLIKAMDAIAAAHPEQAFFAQIGDGAYEPVNMPSARLISRSDFKAKIGQASVLVAHAGMGSVITAMENGLPVVLLPRRHELGEHNTDHQMATARWLSGRPGVRVCMREDELEAAVFAAIAGREAGELMPRSAPEPFLGAIRSYILSR